MPPEFLDVTPVILAGGAGRRLRPLSREERPKPFLTPWGRRSLFQETLARVEGFSPPLIVCNQKHRGLVVEQMPEGARKSAAMLLEPAGRNTAPAIAAAAHWLARQDNDLMLVLPSDHMIRNVTAFRQAVTGGIGPARQGRLVTFGIRPRHPATRFGYIRRGKVLAAGAYEVSSFTEKPDKKTALSFLRAGDYEWNSGLFLFSARHFLAALETYVPEMHQGSYEAVARASRYNQALYLNEQAFSALPSLCVDKAVMEKMDRGVVIPVDMGWRDVGTWPSFFSFLFR